MWMTVGWVMAEEKLNFCVGVWVVVLFVVRLASKSSSEKLLNIPFILVEYNLHTYIRTFNESLRKCFIIFGKYRKECPENFLEKNIVSRKTGKSKLST